MSEATQIKLAPALDFRAAAPLREELLAQRGKPIVINGADVQRMGGQCIQVLVSAARTWAQDGASFSIVDASPDMDRALGHVGMQNYFTGVSAS